MYGAVAEGVEESVALPAVERESSIDCVVEDVAESLMSLD
jgi:hypothetical protein